METKFEDLVTRLAEINDLNSAAALLAWDQTTFMPSGGALLFAQSVLSRQAMKKQAEAARSAAAILKSSK